MSLDIYLVAVADTGRPDGPFDCVLYEANITHNLHPMWDAAGCGDALYESPGKRAEEILSALRVAVARMETDPAKFTALNPPNGWGSYDGALEFLRKLVAACARDPKSIVRVSR